MIGFFNYRFVRTQNMLREIKQRLFFKYLEPDSRGVLVDVGGGGGSFKRLWEYFGKCIIVNIDEGALRKISDYSLSKNIFCILADGCALPLKSDSVDYVFSNAVIEHIPYVRHKLFASELERITKKGYFITTPNRNFPYEPHYRVFFWQWLPLFIRKAIIRVVGLGFIAKGHYEYIYSLTKKQLSMLFPNAHIEGLKISRWFPVPAVLICWKKKLDDQRYEK